MNGVLPWILGGLFALVVLAGLLVLAVKRFGRHLVTAAESPLFQRLAEAHALTPEERRTLSVLAQAQGIGDPSAFFVSPSSLEHALTRIRVRAPALAKTAERLGERLYGAARG